MFITALFLGALSVAQAFAVETAPRISDREIIEKLAELKAGQDGGNKRFDDVNKRFDDVNKRFDDVNKRIDDLRDSTNKRFDDMNRRFDTLQWMLGLFITVALTILGVFGKILWNQQKEMARFNTTLETQKDELTFLKNIIEKLLPPKGVL